MGALVTFPWCFNFHCPAEELAITSLQNGIDRVLDDHRIGSLRLRSVPGVHLLVDGRKRFLLGDELLGVSVTRSGGKHCDLDATDVWLQRFPGLIAYSACNTSCMIEFAFSCGESASNSEIAATTIQKAG